MASAAGSRTGLITASVVLAIVSVTALVFSFIFSADARKNQLALEDMRKKYTEVVAANALSGPTVTGLRQERETPDSGFGKSDPLLDVAVGQRDNLAKLIGGATPKTAMDSANAALKEANAKAFSGAPQSDLAGAVTQLTNMVVELQGKVKAREEEASQAKTQAAETIKTTTDQLSAKDKQIEDIRKQAADLEAAVAAERTQLQSVTGANTATIESQSKQYAETQAALAAKLTDIDRSMQRVEKDNTALRAQLANFRPDAQQATIRHADGHISRIAADGIIYIDLGAGQQIVPGMTFEVYDKLTGVPPLKLDDTALPEGKASLEVVRVTANTSECRVVNRAKGRTITEGDVIANLVYDRNTKYNFVVFGKFDLSKANKPDAADAAILKRLVTEWGGNVQNELNVNTDFLVIGAEPKIPDFSEDERKDPVNARQLQAALAELDAYNAILQKAKELYIPVLNQNRFLYYVGFFDQARK